MEKKNKIPAGYIYTVECKITGEFYVGATTDSLHQRKIDHQERAERGESNLFHNAIATYGKEAFEWQITDTAETIDELAQKEKVYVVEYNSFKNGYNSDEGGGFKKSVYQYNMEDGSLINKYECLDDAATSISSSKQHISRACLSVNKIYGGFYWSYEYVKIFDLPTDKRRKKVVYHNLNKESLQEFKSVSEASRITGVSKSCIARFCRGERNPPLGYIWEYN